MKSLSGSEPVRTIPLLTFAAAREIDRQTLRRDPRGEDFAEDSEILLMGLAASSALHAMKADGLLDPRADMRRDDSGETIPRPLIFLCGAGNNGGDTLALACLLTADPERPLGPASSERLQVFAKLPLRSKASRFYHDRLVAAGVKIRPLEEFLAEPVPRSGTEEEVIVEGLLGTGQNGIPSGLYQEVLNRMKEHRGSVWVALDVPAGLTEDDPPVFDRAPDSEGFPRPDFVYTFGREKVALRLHPDLTTTRIRALPCGFDVGAENQVEADQSPAFRRVQFPEKPEWLSSSRSRFGRHAADHKYSAGHAWIIGGSGGMEGAVLMTLRAFFASGGGYARLFHPDPTSRELFLRVFPPGLYHSVDDLPGQQGGPGRPPRVVVIGPGLSSHDLKRFGGRILMGLRGLAEAAETEDGARLPYILLDAGACALAFRDDYPNALRPYTLLTPHAGEWNEVGGPPPEGVVGARLALDYLQSRAGVSALLKGPISLLLSERRIDVFDWVRPELAAAGSGDLLAGLMARALAAGHAGSSAKGRAHDTEDVEHGFSYRMQVAVHQSMALLHTLATGRSSAADFLLALEHWSLPGRTGPASNLS